VDQFPQAQLENPVYESKSRLSSVEPDLEPVKPFLKHSHTLPTAVPFVAPDLQELKKSSTSHLRALSKFAQNGESQDFSLSSPVPSVAGLQNRRRLKRSDSLRQGTRQRNYGFGERNWMDKQRQFLQAYEYLCHIGEAKEWIEDIIHQSIAPIVELEEALRNGVTLAEIVQAFHPGQSLRIFKNTKLQFKHSDNIVLFFRFLEEVGLPELFRFELIDLYEKKNIPKVIYCIHALSWLLYRKGMVDFRIGNLVGQLQFQDHELEQTQRGLDKAGISMPSFQGMGASFGAEPEPEPEPVETEEERIDRELQEHEAMIGDLQGQMRGALVRMRLGDMMNVLWDHEHKLVELQSLLRGDWARQIINYKLSMQRFATSLQAASRGFLQRRREVDRAEFWKSKQDEVLKIQSLFRATRARKEVRKLKTQVRQHQEGVRDVQAAIRGSLARRTANREVAATRRAEKEVRCLQAAIRGMTIRDQVTRDHNQMHNHEKQISILQAAVRAMFVRSDVGDALDHLETMSPTWTVLQSTIRGIQARAQIQRTKKELKAHSVSISQLQACARGNQLRIEQDILLSALAAEEHSVISAQRKIRGLLLRKQLATQDAYLRKHESSVIGVQAAIRGLLSRYETGQTLSELHNAEAEITEIQAAVRGVLCRSRVGDILSEVEEHEEAIELLQATIRARHVRVRFTEKKQFFKANMEKVVKIQSIARARIQGQAYKSLTS